jgi:ankyrin repeat protein
MKYCKLFLTIYIIVLSLIPIYAKPLNYSINATQEEYENILFFLAGEKYSNYKMNVQFNNIQKTYHLELKSSKNFLKKIKVNLDRYRTIVNSIPKPKYLNSLNDTNDEKKLKFYIMEENIKGIKSILSKLNNINFSYNNSYTPLYYAISTDNINIVKLLIQKGIHVNYKNDEKITPLHHASKFGNIEIVRLLISHGALVNEQDIRGRTPLHYASNMGYKDIIHLLLAKGANKDILDLSGHKPNF